MATIILDYDGTLHESLKIYAPAVRRAFDYLIHTEGHNLILPKDEDIAYWIGSSGSDVWDSLVPGITPELKKTCSQMVGGEMYRLIEAGQAKLYPHALEALQEMKQNGHTLIFLSNCRRRYMDSHAASFGLTRYFEGFYCAEDYQLKPKYRIFESIAADFPDQDEQGYIIVGDRDKDWEVAHTHDLPFIGCTYGYGSPDELSGANLLCSALKDLPDLVRQLVANQ